MAPDDDEDAATLSEGAPFFRGLLLESYPLGAMHVVVVMLELPHDWYVSPITQTLALRARKASS